MDKHTPEPWNVMFNYDNNINEEAPGRHTIRSKDGWNIARIWENIGNSDSSANARRIVSCVNACAGINPEAVPDLVKALLGLIDACTPSDSDRGSVKRPTLEALESARAALLKATGKG